MDKHGLRDEDGRLKDAVWVTDGVSLTGRRCGCSKSVLTRSRGILGWSLDVVLPSAYHFLSSYRDFVSSHEALRDLTDPRSRNNYISRRRTRRFRRTSSGNISTSNRQRRRCFLNFGMTHKLRKRPCRLQQTRQHHLLNPMIHFMAGTRRSSLPGVLQPSHPPATKAPRPESSPPIAP